MKLFSLCLSLSVLLISCSDQSSNKQFNTLVVSTGNAVYHYQMDAGGFSSIIDKDSNDWISFKYVEDPSYPKAAESQYRGLPNLLYKGKNDGVGHPGFKMCKSRIINDTIVKTVSKDSLWEYDIIFHDDHVYLDMIKVDSEIPYWFLYEGTPNGKWDPDNQFWGNSIEGPIYEQNDFYHLNPKHDIWDWAYFGTKGSSNVFFVAQIQKDSLLDVFGYLGNSELGVKSTDGMVVFGFGRDNKNGTKAIITKPVDFAFGIIDIPDTTKEINDVIKSKIETICSPYWE